MNTDHSMPLLILTDIHKFYDRLEVLKGISMEVKKGELVTFVGPSGCGKTTLLRIIGGFTNLDSGEVILDGQKIDHLASQFEGYPDLLSKLCIVPSYDGGR